MYTALMYMPNNYKDSFERDLVIFYTQRRKTSNFVLKWWFLNCDNVKIWWCQYFVNIDKL